MKKLWDSVSSTAKDGFGLHCPRFLLEDEGGQRSTHWHNFQGMLLPTLVPILFSLGKEAYRNLKLNWLKQKGGYYSCSVAKSCLTLGPLGQEQARLPCPSLHWNLLRLTSIELVMPSNHLILCCLLLLLPLIFPIIGSFPRSQLFTSGGESIGASASASVLPMKVHSLFPLGLSGLIPLLSKGCPRVFSSTTIQKHQFFSTQPSLWSNSHIRT